MSPGRHLGPSDLDRVERLVEECMPELLDFFESRSLSHEEIDRIFFDALYRLAHRWETIQDHRAWLLETLERFAREDPEEEQPRAERAEEEDSPTPDGTASGDPESRNRPEDPEDPGPGPGGGNDS